GWQIPILTDDAHGRARIEEVPGDALGAALDAGEIAVVPGFQGVTRDGRITTLGRGGSDTSAVAVAAALGAPCDIYTDVDGVYTTDPRIQSRARRLEKVSYEEMLEMASLGAKVLQTRSVELAMHKRVPVRVLSSFIEPDENGNLPQHAGTLICDEDEIVEKRIVSGVTMSRDEARITLLGLSDRTDAPADVFTRLAEAEVNVDMIVQSQARTEGAVNLTFTTGRRDARRAADLMTAAKADIGFEELRVDDDVAKVSVIGVGMRSHAGVAQTMFRALADKGVKFQAISTSEIKISVLIDSDYAELAVRALHAAYGLDAED
ncbi:MAG TPA: aspartate kinase, partial [Brevundimonas diminuta]|nr:aspartate kinase [Brevundimonas diminuta]